MPYDDSSASLPLPSQPLNTPKAIADDPSLFPESSAWPTSFLVRSHPSSPRSQQSSPRYVASGALWNHRLPSSRAIVQYWGLGYFLSSLQSSSERLERVMGMSQSQGVRRRKNDGWWGQQQRRNRGIVVLAGVVGVFFFVNLWMFSRLQHDPSARPKDLDVILNSTLRVFPRQRFPV